MRILSKSREIGAAVGRGSIAVIAVLAFALFGLALAWDQWLWIAIVALPIGIAGAIYAVWRLMTLQRYYLDHRTSEVTHLPV